jgi:hypothetical protein
VGGLLRPGYGGYRLTTFLRCAGPISHTGRIMYLAKERNGKTLPLINTDHTDQKRQSGGFLKQPPLKNKFPHLIPIAKL